MKACLVYRAPQFSPNSVNKDMAILEAVGERLCKKGLTINYVHEEELRPSSDADIFLSMGRLPETLEFLSMKEKEGRIVLNSSKGVGLAIERSRIDSLIRELGIPAAPLHTQRPNNNAKGFWLKRGDAAAQCPDDVQYAETWDDVKLGLSNFIGRGVSNVLITEHVNGDVVKFYGVRGTGFFKCYYPTDDGQTKFGDELRNGIAQHYDFNQNNLHTDAERVAEASALHFYGGDCIVREDGSYVLIDFNDWPSYSRCRAEAAENIIRCLENIVEKHIEIL